MLFQEPVHTLSLAFISLCTVSIYLSLSLRKRTLTVSFTMVAFVSGMYLEFNQCVEQINGHLSPYLEPSPRARALAVPYPDLFLCRKDHEGVNLCVCVCVTSLPQHCHASLEYLSAV